jgi:hypothetical protein
MSPMNLDDDVYGGPYAGALAGDTAGCLSLGPDDDAADMAGGLG